MDELLKLNDVSIIEGYAEKLAFYFPQLVTAIIVLIVGLKVLRFFRSRFNLLLEKREYDPALQSFLVSIFDVTLKIALFISVASMLGLQTTSFIALLGSAGLAVGLALQGSLSNFAGGVMLLLFKPFRAGHYIEAQGYQGTVKRLTIFHTILNTPDNKRIVLPNGPLANGAIINFSAEDRRRVDLLFGISYGDDIKKAKEIIRSTILEDDRVLSDPEPMVAVVNLGDSSVDLTARAWTKTGDYWPYYWENMEKIKVRLEEGGVTIPFPQRDVHHYHHQDQTKDTTEQ